MKKEYMTSKERVMAVFEGREPDRTPVITPTSVASVDSMIATGAEFPDVHLNAEKMAALAAAGHDLLGFDSVAPYFSVHQESAAFGATVRWGSLDSMPTTSTFPYTDPDEFVMPDDFLERPPIKTVIDAIALLKAKYGESVAIIGKVMGPWTLSYNLYGTQPFLMDTIIEPDRARGFLEKFKQISIAFALAQVEAGADIITWADHATGDLVSASGYEEFLFPLHKELTQEFKRRCPRRVPLILHTCGRTLDRVHLFAQTGFDAFHFDSRNDPKEMLDAAPGGILLTGCVNNPKTLLNGSVDDVIEQTEYIVRSGVKLVSPECAIPCRVPNDNLRAIVDTVKRLTLI